MLQQFLPLGLKIVFELNAKLFFKRRKQQAELDIITDSLVLNIYVRARRQIQNKLDTSTEMLQSLKKIATRRISENNFNNLTNLPYKED